MNTYTSILLHFFREVHGLTKMEVAKAMKMEINNYDSLEHGYYLITKKQAQQLGKLLNVDSDFFHDNEPKLRKTNMSAQECKLFLANNRISKIILWLHKQYGKRRTLSQSIDKALDTLDQYGYYRDCFTE